eukprot:TRINITY_DN6686_c0_g2_i1.p4 TRINITY_DN6686_c0_g2~~TRINITY_DN6686_c0_g2_i1.p4  ORF type:complete len:123 (+),score=5.54 TRINITY_DN6686_c0_g2_i1:1479-1847(+)
MLELIIHFVIFTFFFLQRMCQRETDEGWTQQRFMGQKCVTLSNNLSWYFKTEADINFVKQQSKGPIELGVEYAPPLCWTLLNIILWIVIWDNVLYFWSCVWQYYKNTRMIDMFHQKYWFMNV